VRWERFAGLVRTSTSRRCRGVHAKEVPGQAGRRGGGDLWGYLQGGREQADYYLAADGTPSQATPELHGRLWARLGLERLDRVAFQRLAAGCHPVTGARLIKTSYVSRTDPVTGERVTGGGFHRWSRAGRGGGWRAETCWLRTRPR
jgi:hypothetical protein